MTWRKEADEFGRRIVYFGGYNVVQDFIEDPMEETLAALAGTAPGTFAKLSAALEDPEVYEPRRGEFTHTGDRVTHAIVKSMLNALEVTHIFLKMPPNVPTF